MTAIARALAGVALLAILSLSQVGCVTSSSVPIEEYNLARAAYEAARDADCVRFAPSLWFNAEQSYREGQKAYAERNYGAARDKFEEARGYAEQAENAARLARHDSGDVAP